MGLLVDLMLKKLSKINFHINFVTFNLHPPPGTKS